MRFYKTYLLIIAISLFITACGQLETNDVTGNDPYVGDVADGQLKGDENAYWAKDNFDLQRAGNLLERADDAEEFEYLLNSENGINNLDLNGDGYADYISVSEFDNEYDNQRGFSLFDRFGANEIQEIARIIFDRDGYDNPGARILMVGNDQIYGDNYYYETNWLDRALPIVSYVFGNRDNNYESPYYYNNYPDYYEAYRVVETPVYRTRVEEYYPEPAFIYTNAPAITNIRIKSKYQDKSIEKIYAKLAKPTKEQIDFRKNNPNRPQFVEIKRDKIKDVPPKFKELQARNKEKFGDRGKGNEKNFEARTDPRRIERPMKEDRAEREIVKQNRPERVERQNVKPERVERQNMKPEKIERQMPRQMERPNNPGNPNKGGGGNGGGNGKGNGGGNGGGKGGGKGKG